MSKPATERWALWSWRTPVKDQVTGEPALVRLRVVKTPWFGLYVHWLLKPDPDRDMHDHPWNFTSLVVRGGYHEIFLDRPELNVKQPAWLKESIFQWHSEDSQMRYWKRWSLHRMKATDAHRIIGVEPRTVTVVFVGRKKREWGFWTHQSRWVPWRAYLDKQGVEDESQTGS